MLELSFIITATGVFFTMFMFTKTHIISNLLAMEYIAIFAILILLKTLNLLNLEMHWMFYFITVVITESITGLSIMVSSIRTHGNDCLKSVLVSQF